MAKKDPNKINPKPRGSKQGSIIPTILFIIVLLIALKALGENRTPDEPTPHKPVPTAPSNR